MIDKPMYVYKIWSEAGDTDRCYKWDLIVVAHSIMEAIQLALKNGGIVADIHEVGKANVIQNYSEKGD